LGAHIRHNADCSPINAMPMLYLNQESLLSTQQNSPPGAPMTKAKTVMAAADCFCQPVICVTCVCAYQADVNMCGCSQVFLRELGIVEKGVLPPVYVRPQCLYRVVLDHPAPPDRLCCMSNFRPATHTA